MCAAAQPHLLSLSTPPTALKSFKFRRCSITSSFFKSETANERPCKSFVEFALAKDYREIPFQSLAVAHEFDAGKGSQGIQISLCNFPPPPPWAAVSSEQLYFTVIQENDLKATCSVLSPFKKNLT